jgi:hypothetical protein
MDVRRVVSIWKIMTSPHGIVMEDISNIFFHTMYGVSNMRYFKSQELVLHHGDEE